MLTDELRSIPLFKNLNDAQRELAAERLQEVEVDLGTIIARQGDFAYHLFVVREGTAAVTIDGELVASLGPGASFGEIGILEHEPEDGDTSSPCTADAAVHDDRRGLRRAGRRDLPEFAGHARAVAQIRLERT